MNIFSWFRKPSIVQDFKGQHITPNDIKLAVIRSARKYPDAVLNGRWECPPDVAFALESMAYISTTTYKFKVDVPTADVLPVMQRKLFASTLAGLPLDVSCTAEPHTLKLVYNNDPVLTLRNIFVPEGIAAQDFKAARDAPWDGLEQQSKEIDQRGA